MRLRKYLTNQAVWVGAIGLMVGMVLILGIRFFTYHPEHVHYHANFQVFINGQRETFSDPTYYEATGAACTENAQMTPEDRAHMHDGVNNVVHVHDHAVTWGQFFLNLGWLVDTKVIESRNQMLIADPSHKISFILNGQSTDNVSNRVISDQDKLLVDYGDSDQVAKTEYAGVTNKAAKYDTSTDPKSCGGSAPTSLHDRLTHLF